MQAQQRQLPPNPQYRPQQQPTHRPGMSVQGSYAQQNAIPPSSHGCYEGMLTCFSRINACFGSLPCCCCFTNPYKTVNQGYVGLITRFGKYYKAVDPGLHYVLPFFEFMTTVDVRVQIQEIPSQSIMTKDNVSIIIDSVLYWHVVNPFMSTFMVANVQKALIERTMTTLRMILGSRTVQECIERRDSLVHEIQGIIAPVASQWGVKIEAILLKDLRFSEELIESLSSAAKQKRIGESRVIAAQAEVESAKLMREASDILNSAAAIQIRYLDTLVTMAKTPGTKVVFMPPSNEGNSTGVKTASKNVDVLMASQIQ